MSGERWTYQVGKRGHIPARDRPQSLRTFIQGQCRRSIDFRGVQLTHKGRVGGDGDRSAVAFAAFVEDGDGGEGGAGCVRRYGLAGAV